MAAKKARSAKQKAADKRRSAAMKGHTPKGLEHHVPKRRKAASSADGDPFASGHGSGLINVKIPTHVTREYDEERLGAILQGFFMEAFRPVQVDMSAYYPPTTDPKELANWNRLADERELGRELYRALGYGFLHAVPSGDTGRWNAIIVRALQDVRAANGGLSVSTGAVGFRRPFDGPTVVTGAFGSVRDGRLHRGIDLRAPIGTPFHAPANAVVDEIWTEKEGGLCLRLALQRPDGGFANATTTDDDSGLLVTYAHLQDVAVKDGDVVGPDAVIGHTGNTGMSTTGPHLHQAWEYFNDAPLWSFDANTRVFVDPVALYGGEANLIGAGAPQPFHGGDVVAGLAVPRAAQQAQNALGDQVNALQSLMPGIIPIFNTSTPDRPVTLTITNNGAMTVNGGNAVNTPIKAVVDVGLIPSGGIGEGGSGNAPVPDALKGQAQQVQAQFPGSQIVEGIGSLAGQWFAKVVSPEGVITLAKLGLSTTGGLASLVGVGGQVATTVAPWLNAIPYVGAWLSTAAGIVGPIATYAGPAVSTAAGVGAQILGFIPQGGAPQPPDGDMLLRMFSGMGADTVGPPPPPPGYRR